MRNLSILSQTAVPHISFGLFNLAVPNIVFWLAVIVLFAAFIWARIPMGMEADAAARRQEAAE